MSKLFDEISDLCEKHGAQAVLDEVAAWRTIEALQLHEGGRPTKPPEAKLFAHWLSRDWGGRGAERRCIRDYLGDKRLSETELNTLAQQLKRHWERSAAYQFAGYVSDKTP